MSQPPLSSQIKSLETDLGVQLFIRGKRRLTLTEAGTVLYRRAQQLLELCAYGIASATVSPDVIDGLFSNPAIPAAVDAFTKDFEKLTGAGKTMDL